MKQVQFFKLENPLVAKPVVGGWLLMSGDEVLETARDSKRVFKQLDTLYKVCADNGINEVLVTQ